MRAPPENFRFGPLQAILREKRGSICQGLQLVECSSNQTLAYIFVGDRGAGAREKRGRGRAESEREQEAGEQGAGRWIYMRVGSGSRDKESNSLNSLLRPTEQKNEPENEQEC